MGNDDIDPEDKDLFRRSVKDVKPMDSDKIVPKPPRRKARRWVEPIDDESLEPYFSEHRIEGVSGEQKLQFRGDGISEQLLRRLKRGKIASQAHLDLHGLTVNEAKTTLFDFLRYQQRPHQVCVTVVHGKGRGPDLPILKNRVNNWLRQSPNVVAFCSALPADGGSGAMYVLLKRLK